MGTSKRDQELARKAKAKGADYSLRIVMEARRADIPVSLAFAVVEQESGFQNIFGHDPTIFVGAGKVTKAKYLDYKHARGTPGRRMQGVGPVQLTWWTFQDRADALGGCWIARNNIRVGFDHLGDLLRQYKGSMRSALAVYNAGNTGSAQGQRYASEVLKRQRRWHHDLT